VCVCVCVRVCVCVCVWVQPFLVTAGSEHEGVEASS